MLSSWASNRSLASVAIARAASASPLQNSTSALLRGGKSTGGCWSTRNVYLSLRAYVSACLPVWVASWLSVCLSVQYMLTPSCTSEQTLQWVLRAVFRVAGKPFEEDNRPTFRDRVHGREVTSRLSRAFESEHRGHFPSTTTAGWSQG